LYWTEVLALNSVSPFSVAPYLIASRIYTANGIRIRLAEMVTEMHFLEQVCMIFFLVVNSIGVQSTPKRGERPTAFSTAVNTLGDLIQAARGAKLAQAWDNKETETEQPAKSLAELLAESAQDSA
jgi:hypothetical protein